MVSLPERSVTWTKVSLNLNKISDALAPRDPNSRGKDVGNTKDKLTLLDLRSKGDVGYFFGSDLLGWLDRSVNVLINGIGRLCYTPF
jgi:hypothetical protein